MICDFSRCKRFRRAFVLAASLALLAPSGARAATITHELELEQWPLFDPSLGTLEEVRLDMTLRITVAFSIYAQWSPGRDEPISATGAVGNISAIFFPMALRETVEEAVLECSGIGRCSASGSFFSESEHSLVITDPFVLNLWFITGEEAVLVLPDPNYNLMWPDEIHFTDCPLEAHCSGAGGAWEGGTINLQYIFTPFEPSPESVPEPTTLSLLALGTAIALLRHRRRKA